MTVSPFVDADLVLNAFTMAIYFTLAFTWFQCYLRTEKVGKLVMGTLAFWWLIAGVHSLFEHVLTAVMIIEENGNGLVYAGPYAPTIWSNIIAALILLAALAFLYATVKPNSSLQDIVKRG